MIDALKKIFNVGNMFWIAFAPVMPFFAAIGALWATYQALQSQWDALVQIVASIPALISQLPAYTEIMQANRIYPISEHLAWVAFLLAVKIAAFVYRAIKSHIPTMAS